MKKLEWLHIRSGRLTDRGLAHVAAAPALKEVEVPSTPGVTQAGLRGLRAARAGLKAKSFRDK
jgi:hypothetical protein